MILTKYFPSLTLAFPLFVLLLIGTSCGDNDPQITPVASGVDNPWISDLQSITDTGFDYEMMINENDDYLAVSNQRIIKVSHDGLLLNNIDFTPSENAWTKLIDDKIYRFISDNDIIDYDPSKNVSLDIYDSNGVLSATHELDINGVVLDIELERSDIVGVLVYEPLQRVTRIKKFSTTGELIASQELNRGSNRPSNLTIAPNGDYLCTNSGATDGLYQLDNNLDLKLETTYRNFFIREIKMRSDGRFFVRGLYQEGIPPWPTALAMIDKDGVMQNMVTIDINEMSRLNNLQINDEVICAAIAEPESNNNFELRFYDFDFNLLSTIDDFDVTPLSTIEILGNAITSNIVVNEEESFTFIYGHQATGAAGFNPRVFKLDKSYTVPTNIIIQ